MHVQTAAYEDPFDDTVSVSPAPSIPHADLFQPGEVLSGTYEIRSKLGEGGMGQVFAAWDRNLLRSVAIKATYPYLGASVVEEARALATVRHPSTVSVYAVGSHKGIHFMVMELVLGRTLESYLRARREPGEELPVEEAMDILARVADALAVVHRAGIAHRDVKPANVLLAPGDRIVLTDFGIFQPEFKGGPGLEPAGSAHYLAPEAITFRMLPGQLYLVDVYSMGVMAFEMIAGKLPYDADCPTRLLIKHLQQTIPDPRDVRPDVPPALADLVREMLAKDPLSRPQSMEEIAWRLRRMLSPQPSLPGVAPSVLVVEQDKAVATRLASLIEAQAKSAVVRFAADASAAWRTISATAAPDLIVMDPQHPAGGCADLLGLLSRHKVGEPCIVVLVHGGLPEVQRERLQQWPFARLIEGREALERQLPAFLRAAQARAARCRKPSGRHPAG
jgi:serine/threonine-protein kinase